MGRRLGVCVGGGGERKGVGGGGVGGVTRLKKVSARGSETLLEF